jgi:hypothetical protein
MNEYFEIFKALVVGCAVIILIIHFSSVIYTKVKKNGKSTKKS